jgi:hypothetical protein
MRNLGENVKLNDLINFKNSKCNKNTKKNIRCSSVSCDVGVLNSGDGV